MFGIFKKKVNNNCDCNCKVNKNEVEKSRIMVLGACCNTSKQSYENVKTAVEELGLNINVVNIGDVAIIASYGVIATPALVIDEKVIVSGKLITVDETKVEIEKSNILNK